MKVKLLEPYGYCFGVKNGLSQLYKIKKDYHDSYEISCDSFVKGSRCPYCVNQHGKVHPKDSFGSF